MTAAEPPASTRAPLPTGSVTFLFTDVEGSTRLLNDLGEDAYADALAEHRRIVRAAFAAHAGVEVDTQGDAFFYVFAEPSDACRAAVDAQRVLARGPMRVRMGIHSGTARLTDTGYVGAEVHKGARIAAAGHGGQVLLSRETAQLVDMDTLDLGEHRVKDFSDPVWIHQLGTDRFPPLKTISNTNLPRPASSFLGRADEVASVVGMLRDGARLLSLIGPGGTGKTRLAIEAATALVPDFRNGVFWVPLAPVTDPALVLDEVARALGSNRDLAEHLGDRELLLVLDNFEQVVAAAPKLSRLLVQCPNLRMIITSRERLRVSGEVVHDVPTMEESEAIELFCARSGRLPNGAVAALCRRLDFLPLAVELAASRATILSPEDILERLAGRPDFLRGGRDADPRQATLRATVAWSYELLTPAEQSAFVHLAVFRGGWDLEAADAVAGADLDVLESLVDKSLARVRDGRFTMLETIREFAAFELVQSGEEGEASARHLAWFRALCARAYDEQYGAQQRWLRALEADLDNIRAALDRARAIDRAVEAELVASVAPFWLSSAHHGELGGRIESVLAAPGVDPAVRGRLLRFRGELTDSLELLNEALEFARSTGDPREEGAVLESLGWVHDALGDYEAARNAHETSIAVRRAAGLPEIEGALARAGLCHCLVATGAVEQAEAMANEIVRVSAETDAASVRELGLHFLADCPLVTGDYAEAGRRYERALAFARDAGLRGRAIDEVLGIAMAAAGAGQAERALRVAAAAREEKLATGKGSDAWWDSMQARLLGSARDALPEDAVRAAEAAGRSQAFDAVLDELLRAKDAL